jgi:V/A-type H+-transporting ATPase subunit I
MKKITLVVLDSERDEALAALRKTGVVHVEKRDAASKDINGLQDLIARIDRARSLLADFPPPRDVPAGQKLSRADSITALERIEKTYSEYRAAQDRKLHLQGEMERMAVWGRVDPECLAFLGSKGVFLYPVEIPVKVFGDMPESVRYILVGRDGKNVRCVIWNESEGLPDGIPVGSRPLVLPELSTAAMQAELDKLRDSIPALENALSVESVNLLSFDDLRAAVAHDLEFETVKESMRSVDLGDTSLAWLTGFVPVPSEAALSEAARKHGWAYASDEPSDDDVVPTLIRNNRFVNLISPLFDFLGIVPGYRELDISLWFLLFFGIFFAMIFGDGGYGTLLTAITLFFIVSAKRKGKSVATGLYMILYLALMTVAWGVITCTWFGIPVGNLPGFLRSIALPAFSNENPDSSNNVKVFCFTLGLVQLSLAHVIGIVRNHKSIKLLSDLGSLLMVIGMFFVVLNLVVDAEKYPLNSVVLGMIAVGFVLNFVFVNYNGSIGKGILESLKNIITMFLGIVNVFGDIMSYIRLWAVGLAGAAISGTINSMAGPMLGSFIVFAGIVLLLFGHSLNLVMNVLSVIVHGVRLNTLEFSNHLGLTWSGFKYESFSETVKK